MKVAQGTLEESQLLTTSLVESLGDRRSVSSVVLDSFVQLFTLDDRDLVLCLLRHPSVRHDERNWKQGTRCTPIIIGDEEPQNSSMMNILHTCVSVFRCLHKTEFQYIDPPPSPP